MEHLKTTLLRKLEKLLIQSFPSPATVKLEDHNGIIGVITSAKFAKLEALKRQQLIGKLLQTHLSLKERREVQVIVGVTPDEETGYLASEDESFDATDTLVEER